MGTFIGEIFELADIELMGRLDDAEVAQGPILGLIVTGIG
jgi:hypothetical protein